ncbi:uncharacterized protein TrAtP1_006053 [Trichoderma atroviride]|uniref:uncharacterized protein n=1 Tax=Hypocrea atroviridis TaxID=63577 RepID=UPI0033341CA1|nr:hypothetical protein TrAtP1_006053 [Trichoderma atroviride]
MNQHEISQAFEQETEKQQQSYPLTQSTALYKDEMEKMRNGRSSRQDEAEKDE